MHAEEERRLCRHRLDVLQVLLVRRGLRRGPAQLAISIWDHLDLVQELVLHEVYEVGRAHPAVPVVHNVPSVHDLSEDVAQVIPGNLDRRGSLEVVVQDLCRVPQVTRGEGVHHVVAHGPKLLALEHERMEVAESEEDRLDLSVLVLKVLLAEESERATQVCEHSLRRLVGQLDGSLKDANRDAIVGVRREEHAEVRVAVLHGKHVKLLLELDAPLGHQVDVLQHDPMSIAMPNVELGHGHHVLSLTHSNVPVVGAKLQANLRLAHSLHLLDRIGTRRQDEEDRRCRCGVGEGVLQDDSERR
mmetsp:Transcript_25510/g.75968  ORF Transcript_25510/g.75968 Transcript_25510/m.75968 type:complete len:302 (-) Transcript_25510:4520-5425(-)